VFGRRVPFAAYRSGEATFMSAGRQRWQLGSPTLTFQHQSVLPFISCFQVRENGQLVLSFTYTHIVRSLWPFLDPTYDGIDEDTDFFLAFLARNAGSAEWYTGVRDIWCDSSTG
jgi:hypothetical protein